MRRLLFPISLVVLFTAGLIYALFFHHHEDFIIEHRSQIVDPIIGTDFHGHTFPGATMPFGMVQLSPDTRLDGWDGCSAFHYSDSIIYGFSHTHLSGTGCSDYADILLMPFVKENPNILEDDFTSQFDKSSVIASPGYYSVYLKDYDIDVELTTSKRVGFHKYTFSNKESQYVLLDLEHRDEVLDCYVEQLSDTRFVGLRRSAAWAKNQYLYFVLDFNHPVSVVDVKMLDKSVSQISEDTVDVGKIEKNEFSKLIFKVNSVNSRELLVKVGLSAVSVEGAILNLESESSAWEFEEIRKLASAEWDKELSKILVYGGSQEQQRVFYTSLYHSFIAPNVYSDVDGSFRSTDLKIHKDKKHETYTVFSLWDTYRSTHPLFTLVQQERTLDFIHTFLNQYKYGGQLPVWELSANETMCMIGYHSVPVIVDAYRKGINDFDTNLALEAMLASANEDRLGKPEFAKYGYIPLDLEHESVSKTLEYAFDDWCIAMFAKEIGNKNVYKEFLQKSQYYKNLMNPDNGFMQARANGAWQYPFDPKEVNYNFTEANSWQYSFYVPQDILTFIEMQGGNDKFAKKLDEMFNESNQTTGNNQADITGLIGQYAHGNEPSHHIAYLYNYCGQAWKTQKMVRKIMTEQYTEKPDGLCGNEDCGQMSSWYVFSAMGLYPVNPASGIYDFGSPIFDTTIIQLKNHRRFTIIAHDNSDKNIYIQSVRLNGVDYNKTFISHNSIQKGGKLEFFMGAQPNFEWGVEAESVYSSKIVEEVITPVPYTSCHKKSFQDSLILELSCPDKNAVIYYSINDASGESFAKYLKPIVLTETGDIRAYAKADGKIQSKILLANYVFVPDNRTVEVHSKAATQYTAGGDMALVDFVKGENWFRSGLWQGYQGQDFEAVVDLKENKKINLINARFLHDTGPWVFLPKRVVYSVSTDGNNFTIVKELESKTDDEAEGSIIEEFVYETGGIKARYVKVWAESYGVLPEWHISADEESWMFIDEIEIK